MIPLDDIVIVTVTYGDRKELLFKSLASCITQGIRNFIIVGNGIRYQLNRSLADRFEDINTTLILLDTNMGSAYGFKTGLMSAQEARQNYVMVLDDDAELQDGCIEVLIKNYEDVVKEYGYEDTILSAMRYDHISDLKEGVFEHTLKFKSAFRRFHIFDIPRRLLRRYKPLNLDSATNNKIRVPYSVYSGLFFNKKVIDKHGLPNQAFGLYVDDLEYTHRITCKGGVIFVITNAIIRDIQMSWWCRGSFGNPFDALILGGNDNTVYYAFRNEVYFERYCLMRRGLFYLFHKYTYLFLLFVNAIRRKRLHRFKILLSALLDGNKGILGINPKHPLTQG
ncbi:MAG: glycosyltransferase [Thermodesulfovibrionales bacterium]|nr:glycosyltransferase [Thermodesulfovibrionales bacterium]